MVGDAGTDRFGSVGRVTSEVGSIPTIAIFVCKLAATVGRQLIFSQEPDRYQGGVGFFVLGALCVGIVVPWNDPQLQAFFRGSGSGGGTAAESPYINGLQNFEDLGLTTYRQCFAPDLHLSWLEICMRAVICTTMISCMIEIYRPEVDGMR